MTADLGSLGRATSDFYAAVGERIQAHRKAKGLVQAELAVAVGLNRSSMANIEAGCQQSSFHVFVMLAQILGVPLADLMPDAPMPIDPVVAAVRESRVLAQVEELRAEASRHAKRLDDCLKALLKVAD